MSNGSKSTCVIQPELPQTPAVQCLYKSNTTMDFPPAPHHIQSPDHGGSKCIEALTLMLWLPERGTEQIPLTCHGKQHHKQGLVICQNLEVYRIRKLLSNVLPCGLGNDLDCCSYVARCWYSFLKNSKVFKGKYTAQNI